MAHFAKIDENNIVRRVVVVNNETADNDADGQAFLRTLYNEPDAIWKKTSYNTLENVHLLGGTPYRINFAAIGDTYDSSLDGFIKSYFFSINKFKDSCILSPSKKGSSASTE